MRICTISKADSFGGGASKVAQDLSLRYRDRGYSSLHLSSWAGAGYSEYRKPLYSGADRVIRKLHSIGKKAGFPEFLPFELASLLRTAPPKDYDIYHFHDLSSAISPMTLIYLARFKPVIWTIHDCSPFTGGCLYPMGCEKFTSRCGGCPQIGQWPIDSKLDFTGLSQDLKRRVVSAGVRMLTPSNWMLEEAEKSVVFRGLDTPTLMKNGVDTRIYSPQKRKESRARIGCVKDAFTILISAGHLSDERKGISDALDAISLMPPDSYQLLVLGAADEAFEKRISGLNATLLGYVSEPEKLADVYNAADVFLFCSKADNSPLAILESLSCGTPVFGYKTGGIPELVSEKSKTGVLVDQGDVNGLAEKLIAHSKASSLSDDCRAAARSFILNNHCYEKVVDRHLEFYGKAVKNFYEG